MSGWQTLLVFSGGIGVASAFQLVISLVTGRLNFLFARFRQEDDPELFARVMTVFWFGLIVSTVVFGGALFAILNG
jgi:hypothetical protein